MPHLRSYVLDEETSECVLGGHGVPIPCLSDVECQVPDSECVVTEDMQEDEQDRQLPGVPGGTSGNLSKMFYIQVKKTVCNVFVLL